MHFCCIQRRNRIKQFEHYVEILQENMDVYMAFIDETSSTGRFLDG